MEHLFWRGTEPGKTGGGLVQPGETVHRCRGAQPGKRISVVQEEQAQVPHGVMKKKDNRFRDGDLLKKKST